MSLTLNALTLNCGNGAPGVKAAQQIGESQSDLTLLHCQEADFNKTVDQLTTAIEGSGRRVTVIHRMVTHTKLGTQFHKNTGIMLIAIHNDSIQIENLHNQKIRRGKKRFSSDFNKGGLFSRIAVKTKTDNFTLDLTSAHLDAKCEATRAQDWANLHRAQRLEVNDFESLCNLLPDMLICGFDANTRNRIATADHSDPTWIHEPIPAMQSLVMAPLGNYRVSNPSTYRSNEASILTQPDKKRPNYVRGGMLDLVCFNNSGFARQQLTATTELPLVAEATVFIAPEKQEARDHAIIGSDPISLEMHSESFEKVRNYIACALVHAAPQIASHILNESFNNPTEENKAYLLRVYQCYLSSKGLMQRRLHLHANALQFLGEAEKKLKPEQLCQYKDRLFPQYSPWFEFGDEIPDSIEKLENQMKQHNNITDLDTLRCYYLAQATSSSETLAILLIIEQAKKTLLAYPNDYDDSTLTKETLCLLNFNQLLHEYATHLYQEMSHETHVQTLNAKLSVLLDLSKTLTDDNNTPAEKINHLNQLINEKKKPLQKHRDNDLFSRLLRALQYTLLGKEVQSQGAFFLRQAKKAIHSERDSSQDTSPTLN